jgi:transcriptional regulator with XRE-family HTH domain
MDEKECRKVLSDNIKRFRNRLGVSQLTFALDLGISPNFLSNIENGKKWVSPKTLVQLAQALTVAVYELFKPETPEAALSDNAQALVVKCFDDASILARQSMKQSTESLEKSLRNLRDTHLQTTT